ncbi:MAG: radical SAM protein [Candidatus Thermoplasmatota archaeon]|nr:radical SAM protein [Candidatus Thermoplasmatota archaeon]
MQKILKTYYVWPRFPSVSMSGKSCMLSCRHCNKYYLENMTPAVTDEELVRVCRRFYENNAVGVLLSGGCDKNGRMINLEKNLSAIKKIKDETGLIIKLHTGFVDEKLAENLKDIIDVASMEMVGSNTIIKEIFGLNATVNDYVETFRNLQDVGVNVAPHVCVGLHNGRVREEFKALELIKENIKPETVVIIVFRPTKNTVLQDLQPPSPEDVGSVVKKAKKLFDVEISLGCMRPRNRFVRAEIEIEALKSGASRMEIPSKKTISYAKEKGYEIRRFDACCALPEKYEYLAEVK